MDSARGFPPLKSAMDRVSGWYKFNTQKVLLIIGLGLAAALKADTVNVVQQLSRNPALRESVVAAARAYQAKSNSEGKSDQTNDSGKGNGAGTDPLGKQLADVSDQFNNIRGRRIPLGWPMPGSQRPIQTAFGWLLTAIAASLGAPFWFDILNKFMVVRSSVKPGEKRSV
jgi:hypothetical protein